MWSSMSSIRHSQNTLLVIVALIVGLCTSIVVLLFRNAIEWFHYLFSEILGSEGFIGGLLESVGLNPAWALVLTLTMAGFVVGLIMHYVIGHEKYHGVANIMESVALAGGRLRYRLMPFKVIASAISLGAGASLGPEDPSVQIGSNIGSFFGAQLRFSDDNRRLLVSAGAASAIAAAFNAPIAGVFFALEVILGEFTTASFGSVVLAAVVSSAFTQSFVGANPVFGDLQYVLGSPIQLPFYVILGIILAGISAVSIRFFHWQSDFWHHRIKMWLPLETAITGALVGIVGVYFPQILGPGESFMHDILTGHFEGTILFLLFLSGLKLVITAISQGGGFVGGVFAPTLFMGIAFGSAYGQLLNRFVTGVEIGNSQAYAIAGMAGLLAGIVRAPITAILLVFELTNDYQLILPIMLTAVICTLIIERTGPAGIYLWALIKEGVHLVQGRDVDVMQGILVKDGMLSPAPSILASASLDTLRQAFQTQNARALCVTNEDNHLLGIVTLGDLQRTFERFKQQDTLQETAQAMTVLDICTKNILTLAPDDALWRAIQMMGNDEIGRLPVLDNESKLLGLLRRHDVMKAYNKAIALKFHDQHFAEQIRLNTLTGAHITEYVVLPTSSIINMQIKDVEWPHEAVVASIVRRGKLLIPHGETFLRAKDKVTIVVNPEAEAELEELF